MDTEIQEFIIYLETVKKTSENTRISYKRDLYKMQNFLKKYEIESMASVTITNLNSYILYLEKEQLASSTISRNIAAIKCFYQYLWKIGKVKEDISQQLKAPKVERPSVQILTIEQIESLFLQPKVTTYKGIRDKAVLEILYGTGIRVSELISLKVSDVNFTLRYIVCREREKEQFVPVNKETADAIQRYLSGAREYMVKSSQNDSLFVNCSGGKMSRQGIWKMLKTYGRKAGISVEITPNILRHSFSYHSMLRKISS